jgi:hypothetical protein
MSETETEKIYIRVRDLSFKNDEYVGDLVRFLAEKLPQLNLTRKGNEIEVEKPINLSKRVIRLRLRKFLYKKKLKEDFRAISFNDPDGKKGYTIKEKREIQITYY